MGATDAFLFGVVLIIFSSAITFGFALDLPEELSARLPTWMRVKDIRLDLNSEGPILAVSRA